MDGLKRLAVAAIAVLACVPIVFADRRSRHRFRQVAGRYAGACRIIQGCAICRASRRRTSLARSAACAAVVRCAAGQHLLSRLHAGAIPQRRCSARHKASGRLPLSQRVASRRHEGGREACRSCSGSTAAASSTEAARPRCMTAASSPRRAWSLSAPTIDWAASASSRFLSSQRRTPTGWSAITASWTRSPR